MKNFAKLFVVALVVTLVATMFAMSASAAVVGMPDPNTLQPASDRVVFIMDPDENGELPGDGSGTDPENPLEAVDHEDFDPEAEHKKMHLQTEFYQATEMLAETGGTIVIMGPVFLGEGESYGQGATTRDTFTAVFKDKTIKFTSVYNGVDYRETNGAKLTIDTPAEIGVYGQSIWENIDIETVGTNRVISFNYYSTLVGEGVNCYPADSAFEGVAPNYVSLSGGHRYAGGVDIQTNLVVKSGSYNIIAAGSWGVNNTRKYNTEDDPASGIKSTNNMDGASVTNLVLEGTTTVYGQVIGTIRQNAEFSGNINITINDGKYECDINVVGTSGMVNTDGQGILKINGGDFSTCWSLNDIATGYKNNAPAFTMLDFSGWTGEISGIANALNVVTNFSSIKYPDGVTQEDVLAAVPSTPETTAPVVEETDAPVDNEDETKAPVDDESEDAKETAGGAVDVGGDEGGMNIGVIIGIVVAAVVVICAVVAAILMKKKKAAK